MGFSPHHSSDKSRNIKADVLEIKDNISLNPSRVETLEATLVRAKDKGIKVVLCLSPYLSRCPSAFSTIKELQRLSEKYSMLFVDMSQLEGFVENPQYWYDSGHLNAEGADIFTRKLTECLYPWLNTY